MVALDKRLSSIAELVPHGSTVCDVGTDHALLPIALVQSGRAKRVIACDISPGPLLTAKNNVQKEGAAEKIELRLCSGLEGVAPHEAEIIIIAGMGGETIADIISGAAWLKNKDYTLLLQPMSSYERLLDYLNNNGFTVQLQKAVCASKRLYVIIKARYTASAPSNDPIFYIVGGFLNNPDDATLQFLKRRLNSLEACAKNLKTVERKRQEYLKIENTILLLKQRLQPFIASTE